MLHLNNVFISQENKNLSLFNNKILMSKSNLNEKNFDVISFVLRNATKIEVPSSVTFISAYSFSFCTKLNDISFQENSELEVIDDKAFSFSDNENIIFPNKVKEIGEYAFFYSKIKSIEFLSDDELLCKKSCFKYCNNILIVSFPFVKKITFNNNAFKETNDNVRVFVCVGAEVDCNQKKSV